MPEPVRVDGLAELRKGLRSVSHDLLPEFRKTEVAAASVIAQEAAHRAPRGKPHGPSNRKRHLFETVRPLTSGVRVAVGSTAAQAPQANVVHWGGTIAPRGKPIHFPRRPFVVEAFEARREEYVNTLAETLNGLMQRSGFQGL